MEKDFNLTKGVLKAWFDHAQRSGMSPEDFSTIFVDGMLKYIGTCPVKLLALMGLISEVGDELSAEAEGRATPNVKPSSIDQQTKQERAFNSDNWD